MRTVFLLLLTCPALFGILLLLHGRKTLRGFLLETPVLESKEDIRKLKKLARFHMYASLTQIIILSAPAVVFLIGITQGILSPADFIWILIPAIIIIVSSVGFRTDEKKVWATPAGRPEYEFQRDEIVNCWRFKALPDWKDD